jgi:hypothetical protein
MPIYIGKFKNEKKPILSHGVALRNVLGMMIEILGSFKKDSKMALHVLSHLLLPGEASTSALHYRGKTIDTQIFYLC